MVRNYRWFVNYNYYSYDVLKLLLDGKPDYTRVE